MKKLRLATGILLSIILLFCSTSCQNLIDELEIKGYTYGLSEIENDNVALYNSAANGHFSYEFIFANSGNDVTRKIVTGEDEVETTPGTFSIYRDRLELTFQEERVTLSYNKKTGKLTGLINLPKIDEDGNFVSGRSVLVKASFVAIIKMGD